MASYVCVSIYVQHEKNLNTVDYSKQIKLCMYIASYVVTGPVKIYIYIYI